MKPKLWKAGVADEVWKVAICERDAAWVERLLADLVYVLTMPGAAGEYPEKAAGIIAQFSGRQIADALLASRQSAGDSIEKGRGRAVA